MKHFFIFTLVCTTALNACYTKEAVERAGFHKNWAPTNEERTIQQGQRSITIAASHVPTEEPTPGIRVFFPLSTKNYLANPDDYDFTRTGMFKEGICLGPEKGSLRLLWTLVQDRQEKKLTTVVPTAELWIENNQPADSSLPQLDKEELCNAGYKQNWKEKKIRSLVKKKDGLHRENSLTVLVNNKIVSVKPEDVPVRSVLPPGIGVYFPATTGTTFNYGYYRRPATPTNNQPFWSIIEDDNGNELLIRTAALLVDASLVDEIQSPTPPSSPLSLYTK